MQEVCIPEILEGRDCIGVAKTGSGKTLAFAIPILQTLSEDPYGIYAVILTPTRELAFQINDQFCSIGIGMGLRSCVVVGGINISHQQMVNIYYLSGSFSICSLIINAKVFKTWVKRTVANSGHVKF